MFSQKGYGLPKGRVVQLEGRNKLRVSSNESFADKVKKGKEALGDDVWFWMGKRMSVSRSP